MCLVTDLSETTTFGYTGFIVVDNRSKRIEPYIRGRQDIDSGELAPVCVELVIFQSGRPVNIVTDHGNQFTS